MFIETSVEGVISKGVAPSSGEATILSSTFSIFDSNKWINLSSLPSDRVKPLGTAQAILATKDVVSDKFVIINADDYYGSDAFKVAADFLNSLKPNATNKYANIAYEVINTITENGS